MLLYWHRRDRRTADDRGLAAAVDAADGPVLPVYVFDPAVTDRLGARKRAFVDRTVRALRERYRDLESDLLVRSGAAPDVLADLCDEYGVDRVVTTECYDPVRRDRTAAVDAALGVPLETHVDTVLVDPRTLEPSYPTHSQFHADWRERPKPSPASEPAPDALAEITADEPIPIANSDIDLPEAGTEAARERLASFRDAGLRRYADTRDDLAAAVERPLEAVSRLSPYLAASAIGIREVWETVTDVRDAVDGDERRNVDKYAFELTWRELYYHLLAHTPDLATVNYKQFPNEIAWRTDDADFRAWQRGETGYPLVDAGMRQLERDGYIHNRPRQVVASFLTKHLLLDWRRGAAHFRERLVDHDPAVNPGNWQWVASTGTDSVDVRIFDPVAQAAKYDDTGAFVREYVPELTDVPAEAIVEWPTLPADRRAALAPDYPAPIVDRTDAYERAQRVFERALGKRNDG
ncbi:DNA photolyase family protein [Natrinema thermotolerans]|uniref:DNA photolyase family protein n=1 Tax=Natrinema thermotolerans TaxID=121872 RepID=A0AAF0T017_9EURY|nr:deoxyribodipyrimidine photo-lyase [Natrinema thermotolerans]QCC59305.1 deoxyribodipyrimidine photo-lyase [Natrinema thermotolerans]WMT06273.1 DNA photolyase family protein [Natrinema thermotolerans]